MSANDSIKKTITVALLLCLVCSIIVAGAAVGLKQMQLNNKLLDRNKNILSAAGLFDAQKHSKSDVAEMFEKFEPRFVDLRAGELLTEDKAQSLGLDVNTYDQRVSAKDPQMSNKLTKAQDSASIGSQAKYVLVYLLKDNDQLKKMVLPVHGYGLWGTLYGFMAVENDANTISGLTFYEHKETPGLGAKVDLPKWKALWPGKKIFDDNGNTAIEVTKGKAPADSQHAVDGLSGATLTTKGVSNLLQFWMGDLGYKPFLKQLNQQNAQEGVES